MLIHEFRRFSRIKIRVNLFDPCHLRSIGLYLAESVETTVNRDADTGNKRRNVAQ